MAMLREGQVDLVVGFMIEVPGDIDYRPSFSFDPVLIAPSDHPLAQRLARAGRAAPGGLDRASRKVIEE